MEGEGSNAMEGQNAEVNNEVVPRMPASPPPSRARSKSKTPAATPASSKHPKKRLSSTAMDDDEEPNTKTSGKKSKISSKSGTPASSKRGTPAAAAAKGRGSTPASERKRKAPQKDILRSQQMGKTFDLCSSQDKMLIEWKESGRTWEDIRKKWKEMTGDLTATSTLPNRYSRLKSNFVVIKEEHNALLLEAKQEVEASFEQEKWHLIAKCMEAKGSDRYQPAELDRQYKNLMKMGMELKNERDRSMQPSMAGGVGYHAARAGPAEMQ